MRQTIQAIQVRWPLPTLKSSLRGTFRNSSKRLSSPFWTSSLSRLEISKCSSFSTPSKSLTLPPWVCNHVWTTTDTLWLRTRRTNPRPRVDSPTRCTSSTPSSSLAISRSCRHTLPSLFIPSWDIRRERPLSSSSETSTSWWPWSLMKLSKTPTSIRRQQVLAARRRRNTLYGSTTWLSLVVTENALRLSMNSSRE